jgi:SAM-dependent methyltransferase
VEGAHGAHQPSDRGGGLSDTASAWSGATYERIAAAFAPVHGRIVEELAPATGERFLDLACGTGGVALIAARTGADVTGLDIAAEQIEKARAAAKEVGLEIQFDEGDAQALPYPDASFDAVASAFGVIFAPDHRRAAAELARVCRHGARIAITSWPEDDWAKLGARLRPDYEGRSAQPWSEDTYVRALLADFELRFERGEATIAAESTDACWELLATSVPPLKAWLETLDALEREDAGREYKQLLNDSALTREYVLILGTRR